VTLTVAQLAQLERCVTRGGVAIFGADTVYGLCCDVRDPAAVRRLYELKGRCPDKPAAVMFFSLEEALAALPELGAQTRAAMTALLPGALTLLVPNPQRRYPLAGGDAVLGLRVPAPAAVALPPLLQSSANRAGQPDARRLADVAPEIRDGADLELDCGELPGTASTVVELSSFERDRRWRIVRPGAVSEAQIAGLLAEHAKI
jgi:L-threonylcarbamoyladenylate synthase